MKFKYVGKTLNANIYGGGTANPGDVVEFDGWFAEKALKNPDFKKVDGRGNWKRSTSSDDAGLRANSDDGFSVDEGSS